MRKERFLTNTKQLCHYIEMKQKREVHLFNQFFECFRKKVVACHWSSLNQTVVLKNTLNQLKLRIVSKINILKDKEARHLRPYIQC